MVRVSIDEVNQMLDAGNHLSEENEMLQRALSNQRSFAEESNLTGQAWGSAKAVSTNAYIPLLQGKIAYNDAVIAGNKKVRNAVDSFRYATPLDEQDLVNALSGYTQSRNEYEDMIREIGYYEMANPIMAPYYDNFRNQCQWQIESLNAAIEELNKQIQALHDFADSVRGAYDEANSIKGQLEKGFSALGRGGSAVYQNGSFTMSAMADWAISLGEDYYKDEDYKFLNKLDTKGMNATDKVEYEKDVSNQMAWLQANGWSDKGIQAYVKYLNKEYSNYTAMGPKLDFLPTDFQLPDSYAFGAGKLVIQGIYNFLGNVRTCKISEDSYSGSINENIWTVTAPDGSKMSSAFLGFVGGYIPNLHYTQERHTVMMNDNTYAQNVNTPYIVDGVPSNLNLSTPMYFLQDNFDNNLTTEQKIAIGLMHTLTLGSDAFEDAADPNRQQYVGGDLAKDTLTQVGPVIVGEVGDAAKAAEIARGLASVNSVDTKVTTYLLDVSHSGGKANWFKGALGYDQTNWEQLADQVRFNPSNAIKTTSNKYGQKYEQIIDITGANGKEIKVQFNWIKDSGITNPDQKGVVRLVTAIPTKK